MNDRKFIEQILRALVAQFGNHAVLEAVLRISATSEKVLEKEKKRTKKHRKATDIVASAPIDDDRKREVIFSLAEQFDKGSFLPSISDVRTFLELRQRGSKSPRDRASAFPTVLAALRKCSLADLSIIRLNEASGGVTELGPLADAIRTAGEAIRGKGEGELKGDMYESAKEFPKESKPTSD